MRPIRDYEGLLCLTRAYDGSTPDGGPDETAAGDWSSCKPARHAALLLICDVGYSIERNLIFVDPGIPVHIYEY